MLDDQIIHQTHFEEPITTGNIRLDFAIIFVRFAHVRALILCINVVSMN